MGLKEEQITVRCCVCGALVKAGDPLDAYISHTYCEECFKMEMESQKEFIRDVRRRR